ncbi:MAG: hypothetical protein QM689_10775 [Oscillospiraceae bacterium]
MKSADIGAQSGVPEDFCQPTRKGVITMPHPRRKHPRLKDYDYSQEGLYFITVHIQNGAPLLSAVIPDAEKSAYEPSDVGVVLTQTGIIAQQQLEELELRFDHLCVDSYVIMPTHIHAIFLLSIPPAGASPRPTIPAILCAYKSLTTRACNKKDATPGRKLFQTSFYEKILRSEREYCRMLQHIEENPIGCYFGRPDFYD